MPSHSILTAKKRDTNCAVSRRMQFEISAFAAGVVPPAKQSGVVPPHSILRAKHKTKEGKDDKGGVEVLEKQ